VCVVVEGEMDKASEEDRFFFSPDVGRIVLREGLYYTEYGHIYSESSCIRMMPSEPFENYADWDHAKRQAIRAETERIEAENDTRRAIERAQQLELVESARLKLSEEEFDAVRWLDER
jgi:hypothetical protein